MNRRTYFDLGTLLNDIALNAAAATRTFTIGPTLSTPDNLYLINFNRLRLDFSYTYVTAGTIAAQVLSGRTVAAATFYPTTTTVSSGAAVLNWAGLWTSPTFGASKDWYIVTEIRDFALTFTVTHSSGSVTANDKLTVTGLLYNSEA